MAIASNGEKQGCVVVQCLLALTSLRYYFCNDCFGFCNYIH